MVTSIFMAFKCILFVYPYLPHYFVLPNTWLMLLLYILRNYGGFMSVMWFSIFLFLLIWRFIFSSRKVLKEISVGDLKPNETVEANLEAQLLSKLDHPSIVKFYASFVERDSFCIITEYCEVRLLGYLEEMWQNVWFKIGS